MASWIYGAGTASCTQNTNNPVFSPGALALAEVGDQIHFATNAANTDVQAVQGIGHLILSKADDQNCTIYPALIQSGISNVNFVIKKFSINRHDPTFLSSRLEDVLDGFEDVIDVQGASRNVTLDKSASTDNAGVTLRQGGTDIARSGLFGDNEYRISKFFNSVWNDLLATLTSGSAPNTAVTVGMAAITALGIGLAPASVTQALDIGRDSALVAVYDTRTGTVNNVSGGILFQGKNATPARTTYAKLHGVITTNTAGSEAGDLVASVMKAGTLTAAWRIVGASLDLVPATDGVGNIGTAALRIGNVFLKSGAKLDFNNGNVTLTHSAGLLSLAGALSVSVAAAPVIVHNSADGFPIDQWKQNGTLRWSTGIGRGDGSDDFNFYHEQSTALIALKLKTTGEVQIPTNIAAVSPSTGSLINAGGFGNAGAAWIGGAVNAAGGFKYSGGDITTIPVTGTLDNQGTGTSIAAGNNVLLFGGSSPLGLLLVANATDNNAAAFLISSGGSALTCLGQIGASTQWETTLTSSPASGKASIGYSSGFKLYSNITGTKSFKACLISVL